MSHTRGPSPETSEARRREFERHMILDEVEGGLVTRYRILEQPHEHGQAVEAVSHHRQLFGREPRLVAGGRGVQSADTEDVRTFAGVKLVAIPAAGKLSRARQALERTRRRIRGYRWRAGTLGLIAILRRDGCPGVGVAIMGQMAWSTGWAWE